MSRFRVHTNIALDYPANKSGKIYTSENIKTLFARPEFIHRVEHNGLYGTFGHPVLDYPKELISHVVKEAYVSNDYEIMFIIETLNNKPGSELEKVLQGSEFAALARMVARLSKAVVNGKLKVHDITHVHMVRYEPTNIKKN